MQATLSPRSLSIFFRASACGMVRGKPSKMTPLWPRPNESYTEARIDTIRSSGISCPLSINCWAVLPSSVPFLISARNTSPVEMWFRPYFSMSLSLWVPFPDPGAPKITMFFIFILISCLFCCICSSLPLNHRSVMRSPFCASTSLGKCGSFTSLINYQL